tara:strand:+ start:1983 stop:2303 length:321 start_codon:yes stop_codon:yes gene_type:complete
MIPFIRSLTELMAITKSRDTQKDIKGKDGINISMVDSGQRKRYLRSIEKQEVNIPDLPRKVIRKWIPNREVFFKFINDLDYNNNIQSSYDLTLLARQSKSNEKEAA